jgi:16S rRNA (adenine1518-N6/adenine1519-N6)-dimethyltransferase
LNFPAPKKKLGQHFLIDPELLDRFAAPLAGLGTPAGAAVVEIGPGRGFHTAALRRRGYPVTAIELDAGLIPHLEERFRGDPGVVIERRDALQADFSAFPAPLFLAGNLPYQIATPLLVHILRSAPQFSAGIFLLQKEMAARLLAVPSTKDYAAVTVLLQTFWEMKKVFHIGRGRFVPPPRVDSTLITARARPVPGVPRDRFDEYEAMLRRAFGERRKMLANNFKASAAYTAGLARAGIDPRRRAESLSLAEFAQLFSAIAG